MSRSLVCVTALAAAMSAGLALAQQAAPLWLKGDLHVHDDHSSDGSGPRQVSDQQLPGNVSITDQVNFARLVTGLEFLPLTDHRTYDQHYDPLWESAGLLLIPGEEANGRPHATVHGAVDSIVQGANPPGAPEFVNLQHSIWDAHAQDADWTTAHPDDGEMNADDTPDVHANAVGADLVEVWNRASRIDREMTYAEDRWNHGFRFGIAGASDDHFREVWASAGPGMPTTHLLAGARSERAILDGLRAGHTVLSAPLVAPFVTIEADVDGDGVFEKTGGDEIVARAGRTVHLRVRVRNGGGDTVLIYRAPGRKPGAWRTFAPTLLENDASYALDVASGEAAWYRAEVRGVGLPDHYDISSLPISLVPAPQQLPNQLLALTSPIFVGAALAEPQPDIAIPADAGRADGALRALGALGTFAGFPDVAVAAGVIHVVAETHVGGATRIEYARRGADASLSAPIVLSGDSAAARFPKVAANGNDVWVAWQDERAGQMPRRPAIWLRHSADGGLDWEPAQQVRAIAGRCEHPALALTPSGQVVLAWQEISAGNPFDVMVQVLGRDSAPQNLSREGKIIAAANPLDTRSARYPASVWPAIAVSLQGLVAVAWQDNRTDIDPLWTGATQVGDGTDPDNWQIMVRTRAGDPAWSAPASLGDDALADRHPSLAFAADGTLALAWDSKTTQRASGANLEVLSARSADGGATWTTAEPIAADAAAMSQFARLGRDAAGRVRVVWYDSRSLDWRWRVMTALLTQKGWTAQHLIPSRGNNSWPVTSGGAIVFASTRNARRAQRDHTQQVFVLPPR